MTSLIYFLCTDLDAMRRYLGQHRTAIEIDNTGDPDVWTVTARDGCARTAERCPVIERLYHHLAILAWSLIPRQLYLYSRSLISIKPFHVVRGSLCGGKRAGTVVSSKITATRTTIMSDGWKIRATFVTPLSPTITW